MRIARQRAAHGTSAKLAYTFRAKAKGLHIQSRFDHFGNVTDAKFAGHVEPTKSSSFDDIAWIIGLARVDRKELVRVDVHVAGQEVQEHIPCTKKSILINAGEEARQVLVVEYVVTILRSRSENFEEGVHIPCCEMRRACHWDELKKKTSQNVEHGSERDIDEGNNRSSTRIGLLFG